MENNISEKLLNNSNSKLKDFIMENIIVAITIAIIIVFICLYFYYNSLRQRECDSMESTYGEVNGKLQSFDKSNPNFQYPLRDYYIKSAYNACSGGNYRIDYVDLCNLKSVIKNGCRGLDFEIFSIDNQPVIATSTSDSYYVKETFNSIPFDDVMKTICNNAFSSSTAPNFDDPIFIHLRIKSTNKTMYDNMAKVLESYSSYLLGPEYSYEYQGQNLGSVPLNNFGSKKIIIMVDRSNTSFMESVEFYEYVNITSTSTFMRALHYNDIKYSPDMNELINYNKLCMTFAMPDKGSNPSNPSGVVIRENGCQFLAMRNQYLDTNLEEDNLFFEEIGVAFVLRPEVLRYIPVVVEDPEPQDPSLSYATRDVSSDYYKFEV
jgi:hypothetical protein